MSGLRSWVTPVRATLGAVVLVVVIGAVSAWMFMRAGEVEKFDEIATHFKYGSIGAEADGGIPYWIWRVLPSLFPEHLPDRPGEGYERLGFLFEPDADIAYERPVGFSYKGGALPVLAPNCALCHTGSIELEGERQLVLGMPAHQLDFLGLQQFLIDVSEDARFNGDVIVPAIRQANPDFAWWEGFFYGKVVIPAMRDAIADRKADFLFVFDQTRWGPGRVDTFSPYKVRFGFDVVASEPAGVAELPALWNQAVREGMNLHWDGNNASVTERNFSASIGAGATEDSVNVASLNRIGEWIATLQPPAFPGERLDPELAELGRPIYEQQCATCHALGGAQIGQIVSSQVLGTDPDRALSFDAALAEKMNTLGGSRSWGLSQFKDTDGYANMPLDGVWLRAPYLHNGSVPTLADLLRPPEERPTVFYVGLDTFDFENVGFVSSGPEAEQDGVRFDTTEAGNGNGGHAYGVTLTEDQRHALIEFLKTQ